jgi:hypothetical protein
MRKPRVVAPSYGVGKIRGIAYGMRGILFMETVSDKINPRDTWIQRHLGVMSRTFVSYVWDICSAQQRKDRLGIKMSRRYKDISEV